MRHERVKEVAVVFPAKGSCRVHESWPGPRITHAQVSIGAAPLVGAALSLFHEGSRAGEKGEQRPIHTQLAMTFSLCIIMRSRSADRPEGRPHLSRGSLRVSRVRGPVAMTTSINTLRRFPNQTPAASKQTSKQKQKTEKKKKKKERSHNTTRHSRNKKSRSTKGSSSLFWVFVLFRFCLFVCLCLIRS